MCGREGEQFPNGHYVHCRGLAIATSSEHDACMLRGEKDHRWPYVRVWLWTDESGQPRLSFDRVEGVKSQKFEMPRDPESLMALVNA
ncbi:hypothetical protein NGM37_44525, partial [Streptomyces sp. TRM76130]|nr:hypothetical protein [Streptomyces sp. TRM76130]